MEPITVVGRIHTPPRGDEDVAHHNGLSVSIKDDGASVTWIHHAEEKTFELDQILDTSAEATFVGDAMVAAARDGINTAVLAMGQRGSGKTSTLFGSTHEPSSSLGLVSYVGLRLCEPGHGITSLSLALVEIYGDVATDVLKGKTYKFRPQSHPLVGAYGYDVTRLAIPDASTFHQVLRLAIRAMAVDCISQNKTHFKSTRVLTLFVESAGGNNHAWSRVDFVDMAASGTSRTVLGPNDLGYRLEQGHLNFVHCVKLLADEIPSDDVPFALSALTTMLAHMMGGRCRTFLVAHVVQSVLNNEENLATLRLAMLLRSICTRAEPNAYGVAYIVDQLNDELVDLHTHLESVKLQLAREEKSIHHASLELDHQNTRQAIRSLESIHHDLQKTSLELHDDWLKFKRRVDNMEVHFGGKVLADDGTIYLHLVRLHDDPLFSGLIKYHIAASDSKVGRAVASTTDAPDIALFGAGCTPHCCELQVPEPGGPIVVAPLEGTTLVNGHLLVASHELQHGDTLTIGRRNVFRIVDPDQPSTPHAFNRHAVVRSYKAHATTAAFLTHDDAQHRCHRALHAILERVASIRTMYNLALIDDAADDATDLGDVHLQKGTCPAARDMTTRVRAETIRGLATAAIAEMNVLETRIGQGYTMELLDEIEEMTAMATELARGVRVHAVPMITHAVTTSDDEPVDRMQLTTDIWVLLESTASSRDRVILRDHDFHIRLALLRSQFQQFVAPADPSDASAWAVVDDGDPLQLDAAEELIGRATVVLGNLAYYFGVDEVLPIVSETGHVVGHLVVEIQPYLAEKTFDMATRREVVTYVHHVNKDVDKEETLAEAIGLNVTVEYHVRIRGARGLPPTLSSNVFAEYVFFDETQPRATDPTTCKSRHPVIEQEFTHQVHITEEFCQYVATGALEFQVYGYRGDHVVAGPKKKKDEMYWMEMEAKAMKSMVKTLRDKVNQLERQAKLQQKASRDGDDDDQANDDEKLKDNELPPEPADAKDEDDDVDKKEAKDEVATTTAKRRRFGLEMKLIGTMSSGLKDIRSGVCCVQ
ncbi:Aste57867_23006 [Aphanomyces stellatus]|uniref:Aste57867_23006 protein n=1 Tax=Aphanomyces stellatus TaxID=120398 RepID=A0A485LN64_9STRA|nr:hypothetical protein As57867_022935 [Aphanomyces stellatus]VFT99654.1 Aste57867_23006 [Aphanomyces stellatus]